MKLLATLWIICLWYLDAKAQFLVPAELAKMGGACCCGQFEEIFFPNLDFEAGPSPAPGTFITYGVGQNFGGWTVTIATIDHCDALVGNLGLGNPNGPSFFVDLHGSPGFGGISYDLFGLTPGNQYRIEFWTAQNGGGFSSDGHLKIANGAWLNVTWTVSVSGAASWRKETYEFMAMGSTATMEFSSTGPMIFAGTLVDDIHIFECPGDAEKPEVTNPQDDLEVECNKDVPKAPKINVTDNCDPNPIVTLKEKTEIIDPCTKKITREWEIKDACGNITTEDQVIDVIDKNPPQFTKLPDNKLVNCDKDVLKEFNDWINKNGNAIATDVCGAVSWRTNYDHIPKKYCDTVLVEFIATDHCGNESFEFTQFTVQDTVAPRFIVKAVSKNFVCIPNTKDSLRNWLSTYGFSKTSTDCDTVILSSNFNGDSTKNPLQLTFYAKDRCGNIDSSNASFSYRSNSDTFRITNYSCSYPQNSIDTFFNNINGCDSITIVEKIRRLSDSTYIQLVTCDPSQKSFDTIPLVNVSGCDSLIFNEYVLRPVPITNLQNSDCTITQYSKDTMKYLGQYCDSLVITENFPLRKDSNSVIINTCDQSKADTTILNLTNSLGCDSIVTIYTLFSPQQMTFLIDKVCGLKNTYTDTIKFILGFCDSLVITTHIPLQLDTTYIQSATCDQSKAGTFSKLLTNQSGCDSLVIEDVILNKSDSIFISNSTCSFSQAGTTIQALQNQFGCDSIVTTTTTFIPSDTNYVQRTTCDILQVRTDTVLFMKVMCDSLVFIQYTFVASDTNYVQEYTCDLLQQKKDTTSYSTALCDSVVIRAVDFIPSDTIQITQTSCDPSVAGLDTMYLQNAKGCDSLILITTNYVPLSLKFDFDSITCFNEDDGVFRILNTSDFSNSYDLIVNNTKHGAQNQIGNLGPGSYEIFIRDKNGCVTDSIQFNLLNPPELIIDLGNNIEVKKGTSINLDLQSNRTLQNIFWSPSNLTNCINCQQINFVADQDIWIYTQAIDDRGCNQTDSIFILVKKSGSVFAPNSFSPNGDNINDHFYIQGDENALIETLFIYNRWGEKVFETHNVPVNDPSAGWDGTFHSEKMNPGVFIYYAKIKKGDLEDVEIHGDLTLIR